MVRLTMKQNGVDKKETQKLLTKTKSEPKFVHVQWLTNCLVLFQLD